MQTQMMNTICRDCKGDRLMFARAILTGDLPTVLSIMGVKGKSGQLGIPKSWYGMAFDREGRKLVAFTVYAALVSGMSEDHERILQLVIAHSHEKSHLTTCIKGKRDKCVAHVVAQHAISANHVDTIRNMFANRLQNNGAAWKAMLAKSNTNRKTAANYAKVPPVAERMGKHRGSPIGNIRRQLNTMSDAQINNLIRYLNTTLRM